MVQLQQHAIDTIFHRKSENRHRKSENYHEKVLVLISFGSSACINMTGLISERNLLSV